MSTSTAESVITDYESAPESLCIQTFPARKATVGSLELRRALPVRERRMVGPWCFLDRYGPTSFTDEKPMDVAPHPHIGLQTVSWLLEGEVLHKDSLGYEAMVRPGELNLMSSGHAISHSEETPARNSGMLSGVQLWLALPDAHRNGDPAFEHHGHLPEIESPGGRMTLFAGSCGAHSAPATVHSPLIGADLRIEPRSRISMSLEESFEHALLVLEGRTSLGDQALVPDVLYYLGTGRSDLELSSREGARILLIGGAPFGEPIVMWWNFVARDHEEIARARQDWINHERFGVVDGYRGPRLDAPPLEHKARPPAAS